MNINLSLESVDKFYLTLSIILIMMSVLLVFSFRGVFSMFLNASDFSHSEIIAGSTVQKERLNEAYSYVFNKNIVHLEGMPILAPAPKKTE